MTRRKGMVVVNTGDGKGKTTAALGVLLRAWGRDLKVCMLQFFKHKTAHWGEERAARKMGVEMIPLGEGLTWKHKDLERYKRITQEAWELCRGKDSVWRIRCGYSERNHLRFQIRLVRRERGN